MQRYQHKIISQKQVIRRHTLSPEIRYVCLTLLSYLGILNDYKYPFTVKSEFFSEKWCDGVLTGIRIRLQTGWFEYKHCIKSTVHRPLALLYTFLLFNVFIPCFYTLPLLYILYLRRSDMCHCQMCIAMYSRVSLIEFPQENETVTRIRYGDAFYSDYGNWMNVNISMSRWENSVKKKKRYASTSNIRTCFSTAIVLKCFIP